MRFNAAITPLADASWFLGENRCGLLWYLCPREDHDHVVVIRVSGKNPVSHFAGDRYKNIWKIKNLRKLEVEVSPSINCEGDFHTSNPVHFKIVTTIGHPADVLWEHQKGELGHA
jgi:hypothetical protein